MKRTYSIFRMLAYTLPWLILGEVLLASSASGQVIRQIRLSPVDGVQFGSSLAATGSTLLVGDAFCSGPNTSSQGAAYLLTQSTGGWTQQAKLTAKDGLAYDLFGYAGAISGTTAVVGAPFHNGSGAIYGFTPVNGVWQQTQEIAPPDGAAGDFFGSAISLAGSRLAVGANLKANGAGVVYIYMLVAGKWTLQSRLPAPGSGSGSPQNFGYSLALSGTSLLIGAPGANANAGTAYLYTVSGNQWTQQAAIIPPDAQSNGQFGFAVALSGSTAMVGAPGTSAAYLYASSGTGANVQWTLQTELFPAEGAGQVDGYGASVALNSNTLLVGALNTDDHEAYIYSLQQGQWNLVVEPAPIDATVNDGGYGTAVALVGNTAVVSRPYVQDQPLASNGSGGAVYLFQLGSEMPLAGGLYGDNYGAAVGLSGNTAVVGAPGSNGGMGAVTIYSRSGTLLTAPVQLTEPNAQPGDNYGAALAFDGNFLCVGAPNANSGQGAVYLYTLQSGAWTLYGTLHANNGQPGDLFGSALAISGGALVVGAPGKNGYTGSVYVFRRSTLRLAWRRRQNGTWMQQIELMAPDGQPGDAFGISVAIDGNTLVTGAPSAVTVAPLATGAAYVFSWNGAQWNATGKLVASDGSAEDQFGTSVSVSGNTIAVGAPQSGGSGGGVYLYAQMQGTWTPQAELVGGIYSDYGDLAGSAVYLTGNTLLVGAPGKNDGAGLVSVFTQTNGQWLPTQWFNAADGQPFDSLGAAIAFSGGAVCLGAPAASLGAGSLYVF